MLTKIDDALIKQIANNDLNAFTKLYELTSSTIYAFALSILKNPADAEDIKQESFIKIRIAASHYQAEGKALTWILSITKNLCLMKLRKSRLQSNYALDDFSFDDSLDQIKNLEDQLVLKTALQILSKEESSIICLHAITGWKHKEIAKLLDLPLSTVLSKYHRGLKKLKNELEGKL